ncbi:(2Fe-2S) ferredoxin domain-containing protein [Thermotoga sp. KOL6]|uniref:(2Fe-2S) ferredoxin domain-containing protein n=1 Tax=Thermotoga sp. KOL6 TaxID=126741 RepID=UPI000CB8163D|nr:(2Fe-2S) ferredoxin domain-containing protein [Thermotoga sp. KOL6]PLV60048.1 hypothetical protein AS005_01800 [Thermotoga sp. KOL6]
MSKVKVEICVGTTCHIMGSYALVDTLESLPSWIKEKIDYKLSPCFDVCHGHMKPPIVKVEGQYYENMTPDDLKRVIMEILERGDKI